MSHYPISPFASALVLLGAFLIATLVFHVLLIRVWPLSKTGWKKIDYVWLPLTLLGIVATAGTNRQAIARNWILVADSRLEASLDRLHRAIANATEGACRSFTRSSSSPPNFEAIVAQYERSCKWARSLTLPRPTGSVLARAPIYLADLAPPFDVPSQLLSSLEFALSDYNETLRERQDLAKLAERSDVEWTVTILGPLLLSIGLGLRITKVSGELRLDATPRVS